MDVRPSLVSVGDAYDNAMCESFFATLECELLDRNRFRSQVEGRIAVFDFIEGRYNTHRRHSALDYESPMSYESSHYLHPGGYDMRISRIVRIVLAAGLGLCFALPAAAQYIGVLQSAETMDRGTFKLMVAPIMAFGKNDADDELGVAARGGYAFTDRFDAEAKLGFFENGTFFGADGEYWILKGTEENAGLDFSLTGGLHWMFGNKGSFDTMGFEVTPQLSGHVTKNLELCGALDASFESIQDAPTWVDDSFTRLHLVPGIEYRLSDAVDLVGEIGIGLNNDSFTYAGVGIAFYIR